MSRTPIFKREDNYCTPQIAWELVVKKLGLKDSEAEMVWCPFYHKGELDTEFKYNNKIHEDKDFFTYEPDEYAYVIDNPPYTIKEKVIDRLVKLGKPFALLLPMDTMERKYFKKYAEMDFTLIIPTDRYKFIKDKRGSDNPAFKACWFCFGFDLKKQIIFE